MSCAVSVIAFLLRFHFNEEDNLVPTDLIKELFWSLVKALVACALLIGLSKLANNPPDEATIKSSLTNLIEPLLKYYEGPPEEPVDHPTEHVAHEFGYSYGNVKKKGFCLLYRNGVAHILFPTTDPGRSIPRNEKLPRMPDNTRKPC